MEPQPLCRPFVHIGQRTCRPRNSRSNARSSSSRAAGVSGAWYLPSDAGLWLVLARRCATVLSCLILVNVVP